MDGQTNFSNPVPKRGSIFSRVTQHLRTKSASPPLNLHAKAPSPDGVSTTKYCSADRSVELRKSFTELHNNPEYAHFLANPFLGDNVSEHGRKKSFFNVSSLGGGKYFIPHSSSYESEAYVKHALSQSPCLLRLPPSAPCLKGDNSTLDSVPMYSWIMPFIVACAPFDHMEFISQLSTSSTANSEWKLSELPFQPNGTNVAEEGFTRLRKSQSIAGSPNKNKKNK